MSLRIPRSVLIGLGVLALVGVSVGITLLLVGGSDSSGGESDAAPSTSLEVETTTSETTTADVTSGPSPEQIYQANRDILSFCVAAGHYILENGPEPATRLFNQKSDAMDTLLEASGTVSLDTVVGPAGETFRDVMLDSIKTLGASYCFKDDAHQLEVALSAAG